MDESTVAIVISVLMAVAAVIISPFVSIYAVRKRVSGAAEVAERQINAAAQQNARTIRAELVSANRQAWINNVRDALSEFLSICTLLSDTALSDPLKRQDWLDKAERLSFLHAKLELLLNPEEEDHIELIHLVTELNDVAVEKGDPFDSAQFHHLFRGVVESAQPVLKREWERVKKGE